MKLPLSSFEPFVRETLERRILAALTFFLVLIPLLSAQLNDGPRVFISVDVEGLRAS